MWKTIATSKDIAYDLGTPTNSQVTLPVCVLYTPPYDAPGQKLYIYETDKVENYKLLSFGSELFHFNSVAMQWFSETTKNTDCMFIFAQLALDLCQPVSARLYETHGSAVLQEGR